jgi:hypothetical protein
MKNIRLLVASLVLTSTVSLLPAPGIAQTSVRWWEPRYRTHNSMRQNNVNRAPIAKFGDRGTISRAPLSGADIATQKALIEGAFTHVPASANIGFTRLLDGAPLVVDSRITGVEFPEYFRAPS